MIQSTLEKQQHQITSNVFHPNYIKRSVNRIKRSTEDDSEENVSNKDFKSLLQDDQLNGIDDLINKLSREKNNQSHIKTSDSNKNDTENLSLKSDFDQNKSDYSTTTITTTTKKLVTSTKSTTMKKTSSEKYDNKRKEEFKDQQDWLSLLDNDLEKSLDESFKELVDRH